MQDIEFTIEQNKLWMLQTRTGKRTAQAAVRVAVEMVREKLITEREALLRVDPYQLDQLLHPTLDDQAHKKQIAKGLPASPGAACGQIVFTPEEAEKVAVDGKKVILVRIENVARRHPWHGRGSGHSHDSWRMTSHAPWWPEVWASVAWRVVVTLRWTTIRGELRAKGHVLKRGDVITLDGERARFS